MTYCPEQQFNRTVLLETLPALTKSDYNKIIQAKERFYSDFLSETKIINEVADFLSKYSTTNKTVLVTNCREKRVTATLDYYGLADKFSKIYSRQLTDTGQRINKYNSAIAPYPEAVLQNATNQLSTILQADLPQIFQSTRKNILTVCVIPRAKATYRPNQLYFKTTICNVVNNLNGFIDGSNYIIRHTDTKTTHLSRSGGGGNGNLPYCGITKDTCIISNEVRGKDVLLIDDLYTRTVNIDEDAIQALLDYGAKSVVFYAVGRTVFRNNVTLQPTNQPIVHSLATTYDIDDLSF